MKKCPECGESSGLFWRLFNENCSGVVDGRLRTNDLRIKAYLACEYCSETIEIIGEEEISAHLNAAFPTRI